MVSYPIDLQKNRTIYTTTAIMTKIRASPTTPDIVWTKIAMNSPVVIDKDAVPSLPLQVSSVVQPQMTLSFAEQISVCKQVFRNLTR